MPCATRCWLASERSGRSPGSRCGVARNRREQPTLIRSARRGIHDWHSHEEGFVFIIGIDPHKGVPAEDATDALREEWFGPDT
jgi:hypothetical protein